MVSTITSNVYRLILVFIIALFGFQTSAIAQKTKMLSPKQMNKDLKYLEFVIKAHPDPYSHITEAELTKKIEETKAGLDHELSVLDFYKKVSSIVALIKDGHSSASMPRFWMVNSMREYGAFPYKVYLTNEDELYIIKAFSNGSIPKGAKITAINGIAVDSFLQIIDPFISYERIPFRNTIIDDGFDLYLNLAFGQSSKRTIEYFTGDTKEVVVDNIPYKEWKVVNRNEKEEREKQIDIGEPYVYKKIKDGVGLLHIYAFYANSVSDYDIFLEKTFRSIKKDNIHSLIIDVRGNFGGWPGISSRLFHYISNTHFKTMANSSTKSSITYHENLYNRYPQLRSSPHILTHKSLHSIDIAYLLKQPDGSYINEEAFFNEEPQFKKNEFNGDCYLLTNRDSYSAASSFASTFQCYRMGLIIGEETGGTKVFRANSIYEELDRSGIWVGMSTTKLNTACFNEELKGVVPDIKYTPSVLELSSGMDTHLMYTLRVINKVQKKK